MFNPHLYAFVITKANSTNNEIVPTVVSLEKQVTVFNCKIGKKIGMKIRGNKYCLVQTGKAFGGAVLRFAVDQRFVYTKEMKCIGLNIKQIRLRIFIYCDVPLITETFEIT